MSVELSSEVKRRRGGTRGVETDRERVRDGGRRANEALGTDEHPSD